MKTKIVSTLAALVAAQVFSAAAIAQSSSTQVAPPAPAVGEPTVATPIASQSTLTATQFKSAVKVKYLGIMFGPGLSNELNGKTKDGDDLFLNNRPALEYAANPNLTLGLQSRFNLHFRNEGKMEVTQDAWRAFALFKNVYKDDVFSLTLLPRLFLPTRSSHRGQRMIGGLEFMPILGINPKNSRFSLSVYPQMIKWFYSDLALPAAKTANDFYVVGNIEGTYQTSGSTAITFGFYPEYISGNSRALRNTSNELDIGFNWDFAKNWSVNPFVATEFIGMGANGTAASKNMAVNVIVSGAIL